MAALMMLVTSFAVANDRIEVARGTEERLPVGEVWQGMGYNVNADEPRDSKIKWTPGRFETDEHVFPFTMVDEGQGKCRLICRDEQICYGIYMYANGHLFICMGYMGHPRPANFRPTGCNGLLILKREVR